MLPALTQDAVRYLQDSTHAEWSGKAIRDTVAAIAKDKVYQRHLSQSLWDRLWRWANDRIGEFFDFMTRLPHGREITIGVIVLIVALIVTRVVIGLRDERALRHGTYHPRSTFSRGVTLSDAERLAAAGDYTAAAHALFVAFINVSASRGDVRVHPSKTTGDYARELRRKSVAPFRAFQSFRSRYDRVMYGDMVCTADDYRALETDIRSALAGERAA